VWDTHHYEEPKFFLRDFNFYDNWNAREHQPGVGVLLGEYSVFQIDTPSGKIDWGSSSEKHVKYPQLLSAIAEGVYALGGERNPGTVWMSSYAPSLQRIESTNWTPNMILFNSDQNQTVLSASYWQQWLFARYRGTHTLPVRNTGNFNPLFWVASIDEPTGRVYLKVINAGAESVPLHIKLDVPASRVNGTILTSRNINDYNFFDSKHKVVPKPIERETFGIRGNALDEWKVPRWSINILEIHTTRS
jgi:alpha-L-arabinofuranosidase